MREIKPISDRIHEKDFIKSIPVDELFCYKDASKLLRKNKLHLSNAAFHSKMLRLFDKGLATRELKSPPTWMVTTKQMKIICTKKARAASRNRKTQPTKDCDLMPKVWRDMLCRVIV